MVNSTAQNRELREPLVKGILHKGVEKENLQIRKIFQKWAKLQTSHRCKYK